MSLMHERHLQQVFHKPSPNKKLHYETKSTAKENQLWSKLYLLAPSVWNNLPNELKRWTN